MTYDIDLVVEPTAAALGAFERIAAQLRLQPRIPVRLADFADDRYRNEMRDERNLLAVTFTDPSNPLNEEDVLVSPAIPAAELIGRSVTMNLDDLPVRVVSRADLVRLKRSSDRKQDATDADHLERLTEVKKL